MFTTLLVAGALPAAGATAAFSYPRDDGNHPAYRLEWWRVFGHVAAADGRRLDFTTAFFRFDRRGPIYAAYAGVLDETTRANASDARLDRSGPGLGFAGGGTMHVGIGAWRLSENAAAELRRRRIRLTIDAKTFGIALDQTPLKPPIAFGRDGIVRTGACDACFSHEYGYTRMRATGVVAFEGTRYAVDGLSWIDHEYANRELGPNDVGWNRYDIQLEDGRDVSIRQLRTSAGTVSPYSSGELIARDGRATPLASNDFEVNGGAHARYVNPTTHARYPLMWRLIVPQAGLDLAVVPRVLNDEIVSPFGGVPYFEADIDVERAPPPGGDPGRGYADLSGYFAPLRL